MIRSTFSGFETARSAITASQLGLDTVGHNIANVNTSGYTRQRVDQVSVNLNGYQTKFRTNGKMAGLGTQVTGVNQVRDKFLDTRYRNEASNYGELTTRSNSLTDLQNIFDESMTTGLHAQMENFIKQVQSYHSDASNKELAVVVRTAAEQFLQVLNKNASELNTAMEQQIFDTQTAVAENVNVILDSIAALNDQIRQANIYGDPANEMNDQRNMLLDELSQYVNIRVVRTPEKISEGNYVERLSIDMVDESSGTAINLVDNKTFNQFKVTSATTPATSPLSVSLTDEHGLMAIAGGSDITEMFSGGAIKGYLDMINGKGDYAATGENTFRGIPYYQNTLDTLASTFAKVLNEVNADTSSGSTVAKDLFVSGSAAPVTALNIRVSSDWKNDATFLTTTQNPNVTTDTKPDAKNDNLLTLLNSLKGDQSFSYGGTNHSFSFQGFIINTTSTLSQDLKLTDSMLDTSGTVMTTITDLRDANSAVQTDEEAINMMTFQNYYNAAVRFMTTLDEALGQIIQGMGVVGR
ncbi:flagellar hook-associated protein FlgK [Oscillospiraceae bacterium MB08-C2-2]|nr:flagellar hook-associated protein FlgK [Oscillospiraceae bacterium MB08-C2-2]